MLLQKMFKLRSFTRLKIGSWSPTANPQHTDDQLAANHISQNQSPPPSPPLSSITPTAPPCRVILPSRSGQQVAKSSSLPATARMGAPPPWAWVSWVKHIIMRSILNILRRLISPCSSPANQLTGLRPQIVRPSSPLQSSSSSSQSM